MIHTDAYYHVPHSPLFFFNDTATTEIYTLSLHDALPIWRWSLRARPPRAVRSCGRADPACSAGARATSRRIRSEEHTSELQSRRDLVCRLLLEKKKKERSACATGCTCSCSQGDR